MKPLRAHLRLVLGALIGGLYLWQGYEATIADHPALPQLIFSLTPFMLAALGMAWHSAYRISLTVVWLALVVCIGLFAEYLLAHLAWLYFVQHAGAMLLLTLTFGLSLRKGPGRDLCSRIAVLLHSKPPDERLLHFTYQVTRAWTLLFAFCGALSILLFFGGAIAVWSFFANLLTPVLIGALFVGEFLVRIRLFPRENHFNITAIIEAYRNTSGRHQS